MEAQLQDGRILEFPDGTDPAVIQATVKKVLGQSAQVPDNRSWIDKPGYQILIPESIRKGASDLIGSPTLQNFMEELSKGPVGTFARGLSKASDVLINKPLDYFLGQPAGKAIENIYPKVAPFTLPSLLGIEKTTPEQNIEAGKRLGEIVRGLVNEAAPFAINPAARALGLNKIIPKFGAARKAAEEAAAATTRTAAGEVAAAKQAMLLRGQEADQAANLAKIAEEKATAARAGAESTPLPESDPIVRQLQKESGNAAALAESAKIRLEKAQANVRTISEQTGTNLQVQTQGSLPPTETGKVFQEGIKTTREPLKKQVDTLYKEAKDIGGASSFERPNLSEGANQLQKESGTFENFGRTKGEAVAGEVKTAEATFDPTNVSEEWHKKARELFDAHKGDVPQPSFAKFIMQMINLRKPEATLGEMIIDRQKLRGAGSAAAGLGKVNEARQLGILEKGITADIEKASPKALDAINNADAFFRDVYAPLYGGKSPGYEISRSIVRKGATIKEPGALDVTESVFPKSATRGIDSSVETARRVTKSIGPKATADLGKTFLAKRVEESIVDGVIDLKKLQSSLSGYNPLTLDIALGGTKARQDIQSVFDTLTKAKKEVLSSQDALKIANQEAITSGNILGQRQKEVSDLIKARTGATADIAQSEARRAKEQVGLTTEFAEKAERGVTQAEKSLEQVQAKTAADLAKPIGIVEKTGESISKPHPIIGGLLIVHGAASFNVGKMAAGMVILNGNGFNTLLMSPKGRYVLKALSGVVRGSPRAVTLGAQANALIDATQSGQPTQ